MKQTTVYIPVSVEERLPAKMDKFFCINNKNPEFPDEEFQYELTFYPASSYIDGKPRWIDVSGLANHQREFGNVPKGAYEFRPSHWLEKKEDVIISTKEDLLELVKYCRSAGSARSSEGLLDKYLESKVIK
jgi:hypothetical protein